MNNGGAFNMMIPLIIFLVLLALGQIFNREPTAVARRGAGGGPLGRRPGGVGGSSWSAATARQREAMARAGYDPRQQYGIPADRDVVVIQRPNRAANAGAQEAYRETSAERKARRRNAKANGNAAQRKAEPAAAGPLGNINLSTSIDVSHPSLGLEGTSSSAPAAANAAGLPPLASIALNNPAQLRDAFILSAILRPPPGLRRIAPRPPREGN